MTLQTVTPPIVRHAPASTPAPTRVFIDLTHLGRHVTGIERVSIEQFEKERLPDLESAASALDAAEKRKASDDLRNLRRILTELRTKEMQGPLWGGQ